METESGCKIINAAPDHALGQYRAWRIGGPAAVDLAWISIAHEKAPASHRLLPHGEPSIALLRRRNSRGEITEATLSICGPFYKARHYCPEPREELIGFRIKPEVCAALFNVAPKDYANNAPTEAPANLRRACAGTLRLAGLSNTETLLVSLKADLARHVQSRRRDPGPEAIAAQWMRATNGAVRFRDIAEKLLISERNLRRRFIDHIGRAPKTYARQLQITAAALAAEKTPAPDWAAIAANAGFHDQSHMINAFRSEVGLTPSAFHAERRALQRAA